MSSEGIGFALVRDKDLAVVPDRLRRQKPCRCAGSPLLDKNPDARLVGVHSRPGPVKVHPRSEEVSYGIQFAT